MYGSKTNAHARAITVKCVIRPGTGFGDDKSGGKQTEINGHPDAVKWSIRSVCW